MTTTETNQSDETIRLWDISFRVRLAQSPQWEWKTTFAWADNQQGAKDIAVTKLRIAGYIVDVREWIISERDKVTSNEQVESKS